MADAVGVVRTLLAAHGALTAVVPATCIFAGVIPQGAAAPAISVMHVSTGRPQMVGAGSGLAQSRIQVTVHATTYPVLRQALDLVRAAVPRRPGTVGAVAVVHVLPDTEGPDFTDADAKLYIGSQDFAVTFVDG